MRSNFRVARLLALRLSLLALGAFPGAASNAAEPAGIDALLRQAGENYRTPEGHAYYDKFVTPAMEAIIKGTYSHEENPPPSSKPLDFVFLIAADGTVKRLLYPHTTFGNYLAVQLKTIQSLPRPPHDDWAVVIHVGTTR